MKIAVLASGRGSNFQALLDAIREGVLPAGICVVLSNNSASGVLEIARAANIPAIHLSQKQFPSEDAFSSRMLSVLGDHGADFVALAGYMKRIPATVVAHYRNKITNIHPALLPSFGGPGMYGMRVHDAVIASGVKLSGATVHLVDEEYDRGPIVLQKSVEVTFEDNPETLAAKVLAIEHEIYPLALKAFAEDRVRLKGTTLWIRSSRVP
ncbi:MAG TPA: phosphoribosylglycinamide formyltransferase [Bacteroidota bacterium]